ncbi:sensor histidine kinase [Parapedobacter koreensis]|uniref:Histidine kinase n=1 Tax=Parapedobacter koreensis TaxID=332977 RepID=A0A1H7HTE3_9SPHI|nr:histidine kinase [Parapedobacter koreensis]SEK53636.1 Histidine kinase [Parapedobacter koreensis]
MNKRQKLIVCLSQLGYWISYLMAMLFYNNEFYPHRRIRDVIAVVLVIILSFYLLVALFYRWSLLKTFRPWKVLQWGAIAALTIALLLAVGYKFAHQWAAEWLDIQFVRDGIEAGFRHFVLVMLPTYHHWLLHAVLVVVIIRLLQNSERHKLAQEEKHQAEIARMKAQQESERNEYRFLSGHLSSHTLFNVLNGLYADALGYSSRMAAAILCVSKVLHYSAMCARNQVRRVLMNSELKELAAYIQLQQYRFPDVEAVTLRIEGSPGGHVISPLATISLLENSFKHGKQGETVRVNVQYHPDNVSLTCINQLGEGSDPVPSWGTGLEHLRRRLELAFPNAHQLETRVADGCFFATITIMQ